MSIGFLLHIHVISLFPEMFKALDFGIPGQAQKKNLLSLHFANPRDFASGKHKRIDDKPYGGGPGMVMKAEPLKAAIQHTLQVASQYSDDYDSIPISYLSPQGKPFTHEAAHALSGRTQLILVAGRYEGIDERVSQFYPSEEWSLGDFILSGGELAMMCMIDAICRFIPGVLGDPDSAKQDSFSNGLLDYPHYTKPSIVNNVAVPDILLSGDHRAIAHWRLKQSLQNTWLKRPDLLNNRILTPQEEVLLAEIKKDRFQDQ